jgi:hypothetical protein
MTEANEPDRERRVHHPNPTAEELRGLTARTALSRVTHLAIDGVEVQGPRDGFGSLWRKRYWVHMIGTAASPEEIIRTWRSNFGDLWPEGNTFFGPIGALDPGDLGLLTLEMPGGAELSSGVIVLNAHPDSFSLITPEGHVFAGVITFSAYQSSGWPVAQIEILLRASDPVFEIGMNLFGHKQEDRFWLAVLASLARWFGSDAVPEMHAQVVDQRYQWSHAGNIVRNSLIRTWLFRSTAPVTRMAERFRRRSTSSGPEGNAA